MTQGDVTEYVPRCPICGPSNTIRHRTHSVAQVATHFVPTSRDSPRHFQLQVLLAELWGGRSNVDLYRCPRCSYCFAIPAVGGDTRFYTLVSGGVPHYPADRWEFRRTIASLQNRVERHPQEFRLLEIGAGRGAFLEQLKTAFGGRVLPFATEYDIGAAEHLRSAGYWTFVGDFRELAERNAFKNSFHFICMFQTLEHIANVHAVFGSLNKLLRRDGDVFVSVPHGPAIDLQEELVAYWDMPPNHVGRWSRSAFETIASAHGLAVQEWALEPVAKLASAWRLAQYGVLSSAYDEHSLAGRINGLENRLLRGPLKRILALAHLPRIVLAWPRLTPATQWVHFARTR